MNEGEKRDIGTELPATGDRQGEPEAEAAEPKAAEPKAAELEAELEAAVLEAEREADQRHRNSIGPPAGGLSREHVITRVWIDKHTDDLWSTRATMTSEKVDALYSDGPSRRVSLALGLVLLARTLLDERHPKLGPDEHWLESELARVMEEYDQRLVPSSEPEPSFHGSGGVD